MLIIWILSILVQTNDGYVKKTKERPEKVKAQVTTTTGREGELLNELIQGALAAMEGEGDLEKEIRNAVNDGWAEGDHGDVSQTRRQREVYEANRNRVLGKYENELKTVYSSSQSHAISPEPDPTRTYIIREENVGGKILEWQQLGCMEIRSGEGFGFDDLEDGLWKLSAMTGPPLPNGFYSWSACDQLEWQLEENLVIVGYRMLQPEETTPQALTLRPPSFFTYLQQLDTCDPCFLEAPYFCEPCPREDPFDPCFHLIRPGLGYRFLPMANGGGNDDRIIWEVDYHVGVVAEYTANWPTETVDLGNHGTIQVPKLIPGRDKLQFDGRLEDIVRIEAIKR